MTAIDDTMRFAWLLIARLVMARFRPSSRSRRTWTFRLSTRGTCSRIWGRLMSEASGFHSATNAGRRGARLRRRSRMTPERERAVGMSTEEEVGCS